MSETGGSRPPATRKTPPPWAVDAALLVRRWLLWTADALLPPEAGMWQRTMGIERTQVIGTLAELGVPDILDQGPMTAAEIATRVSVDREALHRVLRAAATDGVLALDRRGRFRLTRLGRALRSQGPGSLRAWARYMALDSTRNAWGGLTGSVRSGRSAFRQVHGTSIWDWYANHPDEERLFASAMRSMTELDAMGFAAASMWPQRGTICDVAGGAGTLLAAVLAERPELRGILVEAPGVLTEADSYLSDKGVRDRVELIEGDLFGELEARADVYVLKNILHDWDDETCGRILASVRATMGPGASLVVVEQIQDRNRPHPFTSLSDIQMLTQVEDGRERSREELTALLAGAGLRPGRFQRASVSALVEGRLADHLR